MYKNHQDVHHGLYTTEIFMLLRPQSRSYFTMPSSNSKNGGASNNGGAKASSMTTSDASRVQSSQVSLAHTIPHRALILIRSQGAWRKGYVFRWLRSASSECWRQKCNPKRGWRQVRSHRDRIFRGRPQWGRSKAGTLSDPNYKSFNLDVRAKCN